MKKLNLDEQDGPFLQVEPLSRRWIVKRSFGYGCGCVDVFGLPVLKRDEFKLYSLLCDYCLEISRGCRVSSVHRDDAVSAPDT